MTETSDRRDEPEEAVAERGADEAEERAQERPPSAGDAEKSRNDDEGDSVVPEGAPTG